MTPLLNIGIIGLGVGEAHIEGYSRHPNCFVKAICDFDVAKLKMVGSRHPECRLTTDPLEILNDREISIVSIASYDNFHAEQVVRAVANGKHVFVEKPLCLNSSELDLICKVLLNSPNLKLSSNLILRMSQRFLNLKQRIVDRELGDIYYLEGDYDYGRVEKILKGWRSDLNGYSVFHGGAIHLIDLILWLTGGVVEEVFAYGNKLVTKNSSFGGDDFIVALLKFSNGINAKVTANFGSVTFHHHKLCVYGNKGTFLQNQLGAGYLKNRDPYRDIELLEDDYPGTLKGDLIPNFIASILGEEKPLVTSNDVINAMAVSIAVVESVETGLPVSIKKF